MCITIGNLSLGQAEAAAAAALPGTALSVSCPLCWLLSSADCSVLMLSCLGGESFCSSSGLAVMENYLPSCTSAEHKTAIFSWSEGTKRLPFLFETEIKSPANSSELGLDLGAFCTEQVIGEGTWLDGQLLCFPSQLFSQHIQGGSTHSSCFCTSDAADGPCQGSPETGKR